MEHNRYVDKGATLASFAVKVYIVCPNCSGPALVTSQSRHSLPFVPKDAKIVCLRCSFLRKQADGEPLGFITFSAQGRCPKCMFDCPIQKVKHINLDSRENIAVSVICPSCKRETRLPITSWEYELPPTAIDPIFGYPLWLRLPCCEHTFWAYNERHLAKLHQYVAADLRERIDDKHIMQWSIFARLPKWVTAAKNRDAVLKCISRLEERLESINI
jgi:hypothetical protein